MVHLAMGSAPLGSGHEEAEKEEEEAPPWYSFEGGMKIAFQLTYPTAKSFKGRKEVSVIGFQAATSIGHSQTIAWGTLGLEVMGPTFNRLKLKGGRTRIRLDLGMAAEVAPGALLEKGAQEAEVHGVRVDGGLVRSERTRARANARVVEVENVGQDDGRGLGLIANSGHVSS